MYLIFQTRVRLRSIFICYGDTVGVGVGVGVGKG